MLAQPVRLLCLFFFCPLRAGRCQWIQRGTIQCVLCHSSTELYVESDEGDLI
jgi:hypothetical protein